MIWLLALCMLQTIVARPQNFCLRDEFDKRPQTYRFTNFPEENAVCSNHPYEGNPHGHIDRDAIARRLYMTYPSHCTNSDANGNERCSIKIDTPKGIYATLWADRSVRKDGVPVYNYGGVSWFQVRDSCAIIFQINEDREPNRIGV